MNTTQSSMKSPDEPVPDVASADQIAWQWSWPARAAFLFTGVVMPIVCFTFVNVQTLLGTGLFRIHCWQSGDLQDYAGVLLYSGDPSNPLYPFLLCSATCMALLIFATGRFVKNFVVRFGVNTGVLLSVLYWLLFVATWAWGDNRLVASAFVALLSFLAVAVSWAAGWLIVMLLRKFRLFRNLAAVLLALLPGEWLGIGFLTEWPTAQILSAPFLVLGLVCLPLATPSAVASYSEMATYAARHSGVRGLHFNLAQVLGTVTWLAPFSWGLARVYSLHAPRVRQGARRPWPWSLASVKAWCCALRSVTVSYRCLRTSRRTLGPKSWTFVARRTTTIFPKELSRGGQLKWE